MSLCWRFIPNARHPSHGPDDRVSPPVTGKIKEVGGEVASENYLLGRVDYHFSRLTIRLYGRFVSDRGTYLNPFVNTVLPGFEDTETSKNLYFTMEERHIVSSHVINDAHASYVRNEPVSWSIPPSIPCSIFTRIVVSRTKGEYRLPASPPWATRREIPRLAMFRIQTTLADDVILNKGAHTITTGFSAELKKELNINPFSVCRLLHFQQLAGFPAR